MKNEPYYNNPDCHDCELMESKYMCNKCEWWYCWVCISKEDNIGNRFCNNCIKERA